MKIVSIALIHLIFVINVVFGQSSIQSVADQFAHDPALKHGSVSFVVIDLETGKPIASVNSDLTLPTASTTKLFSTATALDILGPDYRPSTKIYHDGYIDSTGTLYGNVWVKGGGDPALGSKYFTNETTKRDFLKNWVNALKSIGIKKIEGAVIADASDFGYSGAPDGWNWVDMGNYYGAGPSGLSLFDNLLEFHFTTGAAGSKTTISKIQPEVPALVVYNYVLSSTKAGDNAFIYGAPYSMDRFVTGTLPMNKSDFVIKGSMPDPEYQMAYELKKELIASGIHVMGDSKAARQFAAFMQDEEGFTFVHDYKGEKLIHVINETNMRSVNLFAEHLLNLIAFENTGDGSMDAGLKTLDAYWKSKINTEGLHINDGSGLSRTNAISANHYAALLKYMHRGKYATDFKNSLPIAGVSGTLTSVCKGQAAQNRMYAKSGTMNRIKSYAGYIDGKSGKKYAFALIANNYSCSSTVIRQKMETVFNAIANQ